MKINNTLQFDRIQKTIGLLSLRINERFPDSGLSKTCRDFHLFNQKSKTNIAWIIRPIFYIRAMSYLIIAVICIFVIYSCYIFIDFRLENTFSEWATVAEASINDLILIGAAFFFLFTLENRVKRTRALKYLNEIRGFAHVVDMLQLTKDPQLIGETLEKISTQNSPKRELSKFELQRYFDYCSEFLSLIGKVAAVYAQSLPDEVVVRSSSEIENLCSSITNKIWQKILILNLGR